MPRQWRTSRGLDGSHEALPCCLQIVNLVSNDVRRFDDAMPFWAFLWVGPLELTCVLVLLSIQLGAPAAFAGVATMLLVIPLQVCQLGLLPNGICCHLQGWPPLPHSPGLV